MAANEVRESEKPRDYSLSPSIQREFGISPFTESNFFNPGNMFVSPWQTMQRMQEEMERMLPQSMRAFSQFHAPLQAQSWMPSVDVSEAIKHWTIEADLPGVRNEDVDVQVQNHQLIIRAELRQPEHKNEQEESRRHYYRRERRYGFFERVMPLPENVNEDQISCSFKDGVLTCNVPKKEDALGEQGRRIPISGKG
jgi:HSP20 family protein